MKQFLEPVRWIKPVILVASMVMSSAASAGLINANFSNGLNGWEGDVIQFNGVDDQYQSNVDVAGYNQNFSTGSNSVTLTPSTDFVNDYWGIYLFQQFLVGGNNLTLSLNFDLLTDDASAAFINLVDINGDLLHDFINDGLSVDLSTLANNLVSLQFGIEDWNYTYNDFLTVSNIIFTTSEHSASVPEPSTLLLFTSAFLVLISRKLLVKQK